VYFILFYQNVVKITSALKLVGAFLDSGCVMEYLTVTLRVMRVAAVSSNSKTENEF